MFIAFANLLMTILIAYQFSILFIIRNKLFKTRKKRKQLNFLLFKILIGNLENYFAIDTNKEN